MISIITSCWLLLLQFSLRKYFSREDEENLRLATQDAPVAPVKSYFADLCM